VIDENVQTDNRYDMVSDADFRIEWFSGTGAGGQHRNKKKCSCRMIHIPTGLSESRQGRKRESNQREAKQALLNTLTQYKHNSADQQIADVRKNQVGYGDRGNKIRTYRFQENRVINHITGKSIPIKQAFRGNLSRLWE